MKKIKTIFVFIGCILILSGCSDTKSTKKISYDTSGLNHTTCTRDAYTTDDNTNVDINYDLYYDDDDYLQILNSTEKITSSDKEVLDKYEEAYKKIYKVYDDVEYYDNLVIRKDDSVTSTTTINYGKIDMDKILEIEGTENNVKVVDGKIKISDWKNFAKKYGTICK